MLVVFALTPALAQDNKFSKQKLDQMLAPIALYPDDLLTNVLMASTYPLDVVQAERWRKEPENARLKGDALAKRIPGSAGRGDGRDPSPAEQGRRGRKSQEQ